MTSALQAHSRDPSLVDVEELVRALESDPKRGLTVEQASRRLEELGPNRLDAGPGVPLWRKLLAQFRDPLVYLLLGAVVVSLIAWAAGGAVGVPIEALVITLIVITNAVLGFIQERQAERAVAALQEMAAPTARVLREGEEHGIPAHEVVPGDLLVLREGDHVSADGRLLEAASLMVAEAALTGESEAVLKETGILERAAPVGDRFNTVFMGTTVTRGRGLALVTSTGMRTEMGHIATLLERTKDEETPLERETRRVGRTLGIGVIVIALVVVATILLTSKVEGLEGFVDVLLLGVSLAVAAVPEGLPAILTVVLAIGVQRMAKQRAIVKRLSSVETLGSASVICSDKTGTLTKNEMTIRRIVTRSGEVELTGIGYRPEGELLHEKQPLDEGPLYEEVRAVLLGGSLANDASLREDEGEWRIEGDPTDAAFLVAERKLGLHEERARRFKRRAEIPFSSERKRMSTLEEDRERESRISVVTKGAPDVLLARCTHERHGEEEVPLDDARREEIRAAVDRLADDALRTLAVAYRRLETREPPDAQESLEHGLVLAGVVGIIDPPREEAAEAIAEAHHAGVRVLMITGDHARTASRIARDLGITKDDPSGAGEGALTGHELDALDDEALREKVRSLSVYARVSPEHKLRIIDALQHDGSVVAMTGDGVNDAPALKAADIGIAMGRTGTDVSKEAANMILADDNFATIVAAIREGRAIFDNIKKALRYLLSSNMGEVLTVFLGVAAASFIGLQQDGALVAPLLATQILWINLLTDSAPALALGFDPPPPEVMDEPPRALDERIIDREMQLGLLYVGLVMAAVTLLTLDAWLPGGLLQGSRSVDEARTAAFTVLVLAQLFNAFNSRSERRSAFRWLFHNPRLFGAVALSLVLQVLVVHLPFLNEAFGTVPLSLEDWLFCAVAASFVLWAEEGKKLLVRLFARRG